MAKIRNISEDAYWKFQGMRGNKTNDEYMQFLLTNADPTTVVIEEEVVKKKKMSKKDQISAKKQKLLDELRTLEG